VGPIRRAVCRHSPFIAVSLVLAQGCTESRPPTRSIPGQVAVHFAADSIVAGEADGVISVTLVRDDQSDSLSCVLWAEPRTAFPGSDFTVSSSRIAFSPGDSSARGYFEILEDHRAELPEAFLLSFTGSAGDGKIVRPRRAPSSHLRPLRAS